MAILKMLAVELMDMDVTQTMFLLRVGEVTGQDQHISNMMICSCT